MSERGPILTFLDLIHQTDQYRRSTLGIPVSNLYLNKGALEKAHQIMRNYMLIRRSTGHSDYDERALLREIYKEDLATQESVYVDLLREVPEKVVEHCEHEYKMS